MWERIHLKRPYDHTHLPMRPESLHNTKRSHFPSVERSVWRGVLLGLANSRIVGAGVDVDKGRGRVIRRHLVGVAGELVVVIRCPARPGEAPILEDAAALGRL